MATDEYLGLRVILLICSFLIAILLTYISRLYVVSVADRKRLRREKLLAELDELVSKLKLTS